MSIPQNNIVTLSIKELLDPSDRYIIPIYQRNYAWEEGQITQLIQDVIDYLPSKDRPAQNYYLGTLVVFERKEGKSTVYETIDGQQRLTTLWLLACVLRYLKRGATMSWLNRPNLEFSSRKISSETLSAAYDGLLEKGGGQMNYNAALENGYSLLKKTISSLKRSESHTSLKQFCDYLFEYVKIMRVTVPEDTDLNHYFEIMNNRGEQLEKHEVLKSHLLSELDQTNKAEGKCFNLIWEACSNMEKYVQYGFDTKNNQRDIVFKKGNWNELQVTSFDELVEKLKYTISASNEDEESLTIDKILKNNTLEYHQSKEDDAPERFNSVINFSNFLLHVLRVQTQEDIPLDDKRLLGTFRDELNKAEDRAGFVKEFGYNLLVCKFLFDQYIIKREFKAGEDKWSLKKLKWNKDNKVSYVNTFGNENIDEYSGENRTALMLLSMFHVSTPTLVYKHWLNAALYHIFYEEVSGVGYIAYLESLAKCFVFDRFLAIEHWEYYDIIYGNDAEPQHIEDDITTEKLKYGNIANNLVFNYLDYLLWKNYKGTESKVKTFEFTFRSSVEHYYPQTPEKGYEPLLEESLHDFGNLCLVSHEKNSRLHNRMPFAKIEYYKTGDIDSLKQHAMMKYDSKSWGVDSIQEHGDEMRNLLFSQIESE